MGDNPLAKARGLFPRTGGQTMVYLLPTPPPPHGRIVELERTRTTRCQEAPRLHYNFDGKLDGETTAE